MARPKIETRTRTLCFSGFTSSIVPVKLAKAPSELILPHPRMQDRAFVMVPLCDVAPLWVHPVTGLTAREICAALPAHDRAEVVPIVRENSVVIS